MNSNLKCIPHSGDHCDEPARWYVWYEGCGGVYTYHCDTHLAYALMSSVAKVVQVDLIEKVRNALQRD